MKKLPIEVLDNYNKFELKKLKKYINKANSFDWI